MTRTQILATFLFVIALTATGKASAQNYSEYHHSTFQVSFFPPLSTNGKHAGLYTNDISLNLLVGVSKNEQAFALAGLGNIIKNDASGAQIAGLVNYTGGRGHGLQWAGLANIVRGDHTGLQWAGLANTADRLDGFQVAGLANIADDALGVQVAGLANLAEDVKGAQVSGLVNIAEDIDGLQVAGLVNVAERVRGVQFAALVNVAESSDYPIGLVNIIRDGEMSIAAGYNEIGTASLTFRSGGRVTYGILGLGYNHNAPRKEAWSVIGGYGAHINILPWFRINNEITIESSLGLFSNDDHGTFKTGYALLPAFRPARSIEIFGGPSVNYMYSTEENMFGMFPNHSFWEKESTRKRGAKKLQQAFVGWQVGVQYLF